MMINTDEKSQQEIRCTTESFIWSDTVYSPRQLMDKFQEFVPFLTIVTEGYLGRDEEMNSFGADEIYWVKDIVKIPRLVLKNESDAFFSVPVDCKLEIQPMKYGQPDGKSTSLKQFWKDSNFGQFSIVNGSSYDVYRGAGDGKPTRLGVMTITNHYEERHILVHSLCTDGIENSAGVIPMYIPITMAIAVAYETKNVEDFYNIMRTIHSTTSSLPRATTLIDSISQSNEIMMYEQKPSEGEYDTCKYVALEFIGRQSSNQVMGNDVYEQLTLTKSKLKQKTGKTGHKKNTTPPVVAAKTVQRSMVDIRDSDEGKTDEKKCKAKTKIQCFESVPKSTAEQLPCDSNLMIRDGKFIWKKTPPTVPEKSFRTVDTPSSDNVQDEKAWKMKDEKRLKEIFHPALPEKSRDNVIPLAIEDRDSKCAGRRAQMNVYDLSEQRYNANDALSVDVLKQLAKVLQTAELPHKLNKFINQMFTPIFKTWNSGDRSVSSCTSQETHERCIKLSDNASKIRNFADVPKDLSSLDCDDVGECLSLLNLPQHRSKFKEEQVDGILLTGLSQVVLEKDFSFSQFCAMKLVRFINGWRPNLQRTGIATDSTL